MTTSKPSTLEDEYFVREDAERIRQLHLQEVRRLKEHEKEELRRLHHGHCAECGVLVLPEKVADVAIFHCPNCGGAILPRSSWEKLHRATEPHGLRTVVDAVLNWFRGAAYKP
jgi:predicted RNA-binding Zn-ribbon protein involved in translation (DUF1610 family)